MVLRDIQCQETLFARAESLFKRISQDNEVLKTFQFHSFRVMHFSIKLAKAIGCYDEDLKVAALLHDIGKIGISKKILLKPGKLDDLEYQIIQAHSTIGNNIVRTILEMPKAAVYVRDHHERWDGRGYPRGLKANEISLQGRIIGICDAFDTMTIDRRNYHVCPITYDEALQELKSCAWTQFDGSLVNEFEQIIDHLRLPLPGKWEEDLEQINALFADKEENRI
ncbi:HD-GYP domain-containing protein [Halalkalibacterium ligniniphilum]|uniref:HD-GYP domain-containing protein n=1 Tax=Halalkalibacterium ligniniphilum TaxID=1134413 RepID=UPI0003453F48|nr:HD domain-containing phosphohydrolase [Halalkalibacterium ligniniphilum]